MRRVSLVPPWYLPGGANGSFLPPWCLAGCPIDPFPASRMDPVLPPLCLASCPMSPFPPPSCFSGCPHGPFLPLWCLPVRGNPVLACATGSQPWSPPQDLPRAGPIAIEIVLKVIQNPAPFQNRDSIGNRATSLPGASLVPPRRCKWFFPASLVPPGCPIDPFPASWCQSLVPSQAVQMDRS